MIPDFQYEELQEKVGQVTRLIEMVYADPDNAELWAKLLGWASEHKSYVSDCYNEPEAKGYDISEIDVDNLGF